MASENQTQNRVYGQQVRVYFDNGDGTEQYLGLVDNFHFQFDDVVKANAALGQAGKGKIEVLNDGGTGSFEDKQADSTLLTFFINQAAHQRGGVTAFSLPIDGQRGATPYYVVHMVTTFVDDTELELKFYGPLHNYDGGVSGNKEEFGEKWQITWDYVTFKVDDVGASVNAETTGLFSSALDFINNADGGNLTPQEYYVSQPD